MSTANHSASKYRNQTQKLEDKQSCGAHQTDNGRVGWDHQIHTSRLPRMIRNHMYTRLYQAPCQLCLTTSLLATDGISHEGPRFFTLVQPWRTSMSVMFHFTQNIQVRQQWRWACNLRRKKYSLKSGSMKTPNTLSRISSMKPSTLQASPVIAASPVPLYSSPPVAQSITISVCCPQSTANQEVPSWWVLLEMMALDPAQNMWKINPALISNSSGW